MRSFCTGIAIAILTILETSASAQSITTLTPNSGAIGQTVDVVIRGVNTHFQQNVSIVNFGQGINVQNLRIPNPLTITATIQITGAALPGFKDVIVTTGSEAASIFNGFEVFTSTGNLRGNIVLVPIESISLSNVDLTKPASSPILLFVNISNDNIRRYITVRVSVSADSRGLIGTMSTSPLVLQENANMRLTNRDFRDVAINGARGYEFLDIVRNIGTFPPDNYTYRMEIVDQNGTILVTDDGINVVTNIHYNPELIWPGADFTSSIQEVNTQYPVFQWFGQLDRYDFYLFELLDGQTPQEATRNIPVYKQENISSTSLIYPVYAEKLVDGKKYAWYILGKISTAKGDKELPSQPFRFIYKDISGINNEARISRIDITPQEADVKSKEKLQFNAVLYDDKGAIVSDVKPEWNITPDKGYITQGGLFTAGDTLGTIAVVVKTGSVTEYAIVNIRPNIQDIRKAMTDDMLRKLFGLTEE